MNFLAHVQLSGGNAKLMTGNLVADAYKGNKHSQLIREVQLGVLLHRKIDHFTDTNSMVLSMKKVLTPYFNRYAGIALDVYFDHFLSIHWQKFNNSTLSDEIVKFHSSLAQSYEFINDMSREFIEKLIKYNWLNSYGDMDKLEEIFKQMALRFGIKELNNSILPLNTHYKEIDATFNAFYPLLVEESRQFILSVGL